MDASQLSEKVSKQIRRIATALEVMEQTAMERTCYKKDRSQGMVIYKPILKKLTPSYSIATNKDGQWVLQVNRYKNIGQFKDLVMDLIENIEPDFLRISTYQNDSPNYINSGEVVYTIVLNEDAGDPPVIHIGSKNPNEEDDTPEEIQFEDHPGVYTSEGIVRKYDKLRDELELGRMDAIRSEMGLQMQLVQKENELTLYKSRVEQQIANLQGDLSRQVEENRYMKGKLNRLYEERNKLLSSLRNKKRLLNELNMQLEQINNNPLMKNKNLLNVGGVVLGRVLQQFAQKSPKLGKALDGFIQGCESALEGIVEDEEVQTIDTPKKGGGAESPTEEEAIRNTLCEWICTITDKQALIILLHQADLLQKGELSISDIHQQVVSAKRKTGDSTEK